MRAFNDVAPYTHLVDEPQRPPAVVLRDRRRDGVRRLRRRPGRRGRGRGRHGWVVGRDQRRERGRRGGRCRWRSTTRTTSATTRATSPRRRPGSSSPGRSSSSPSSRPRRRRSLIRRAGRSAPPSPARAWSSASCRGCRRSADRCCRCRGCGRGTTRCSCRCTAPTRRRTPPSRWPPSRRSRGSEPLDEELVKAAFAEVTSPGRLEIIRAQPDDRARRRAQPARRRGDRRGARGLVHVLAADRRDGRDGRQGPRGRCSRRSSRCSRTSSAPRTRPSARCPPRSWPRPPARSSARIGSPWRRDLGRRDRPGRRAGRGGRGLRRRAGSGAVLVTGSVITVGEARALLRGRS